MFLAAVKPLPKDKGVAGVLGEWKNKQKEAVFILYNNLQLKAHWVTFRKKWIQINETTSKNLK